MRYVGRFRVISMVEAFNAGDHAVRKSYSVIVFGVPWVVAGESFCYIKSLAGPGSANVTIAVCLFCKWIRPRPDCKGCRPNPSLMLGQRLTSLDNLWPMNAHVNK